MKILNKKDRRMIEEFKEWWQNRHEYAKKWKKENPDGKVVDILAFF
jgi:hypothetical protein